MVQLVANHDVWGEILRYFRVSLSDDTADAIKHKRHTILSVALTCSELTDVGLNELWRSMTTLKPLVRVFGDGFVFQPGQYWDIDASPSEIKTRAHRLHLYLCRIQYLRFDTFPELQERALWQDLPIPKGVPHLCPNLRGLSLELRGIGRDLMYNLSPFISPSLTEITLTVAGSQSDWIIASVFLSILERHDIKLLHMTYRGYTHPNLFRHITQFSSLTSLTIGSRVDNGTLLDEAHIASFQNLSRLTRLEMDLQVMSQGSGTKFGHWLARLDGLSTLSLHIRWATVPRSIFGSLIFASVRSLSLFFWSPWDTTSKDLFTYISSAFPTLQSLVIHSNYNGNSLRTHVTWEDIMMLKGKVMERIDLRTLPFALKPDDFVSLLIVWPSLKEITIQPVDLNHTFEAEPILSGASMYGVRLQRLRLPLKFSSLATESLSIVSPSNCPLRELISWRLNGVPSDVEKRLMFLQNLINLFPRLDVLWGCSEASSLQPILSAFQSNIRVPPRRPDHLFFYD